MLISVLELKLHNSPISDRDQLDGTEQPFAFVWLSSSLCPARMPFELIFDLLCSSTIILHQLINYPISCHIMNHSNLSSSSVGSSAYHHTSHQQTNGSTVSESAQKASVQIRQLAQQQAVLASEIKSNPTPTLRERMAANEQETIGAAKTLVHAYNELNEPGMSDTIPLGRSN